MTKVNIILFQLFGTLCLAVFAVSSSEAGSTRCIANSGEHRAALLELFTSEGCSSCPPADRFLSSLPGNGFTADRVVPLAFHVDYWDYIGWKDRFAQPAFTTRQKRMASINALATIYTPQFLVSGKDVRAGFTGGKIKKAIEAINGSAALASIELEVVAATPSGLELKARIEVPERAQIRSAVSYLAIYENGLSSVVERGENRGKRLQHDFVVRRLIGPITMDGQGLARFHDTIPLANDWVMERLGIAAVVQNRFNGDVLQSLQLALPCT